MSVVYIVEDDVNICEIETYALKNAGFEVKGFEGGRDFIQAVKKRIPSLIILDIMLPEEDGLEILKELRGSMATKHIPVIMVTARSSELDKVKGLDMGADDYITKPFGVMELISRVKALLRRVGGQYGEDVISCGDITLDAKKHVVKVKEEVCELTFKEFELLHYMMINQGIVLSREQMMNQVWGFDYQGESRTVDMHIKTLRKKLGEERSSIRTVRNVGYVME